MPKMTKDVHTEHCCLKHGCKYGDPKCTVITKQKSQSHPCEDCDYAKETLNSLLMELTNEERMFIFKDFCYFCGRHKDGEPCYCMRDD